MDYSDLASGASHREKNVPQAEKNRRRVRAKPLAGDTDNIV